MTISVDGFEYSIQEQLTSLLHFTFYFVFIYIFPFPFLCLYSSCSMALWMAFSFELFSGPESFPDFEK